MDDDLIDFLVTEICPVIGTSREAYGVRIRIRDFTRHVLNNMSSDLECDNLQKTGIDILFLLSTRRKLICFPVVLNVIVFPVVLNVIVSTLEESAGEDPALYKLCLRLLRKPDFVLYRPNFSHKEEQVILKLMDDWMDNISIEYTILKYLNECVSRKKGNKLHIGTYMTFFRNQGYPFAIYLMEKYPTDKKIQRAVINFFADIVMHEDSSRVDINDLLHSLAFDSLLNSMRINSKDHHIQEVGLIILSDIFANTNKYFPQLPGQLSNITAIAVIILNVLHQHKHNHRVMINAFAALNSIMNCYYYISNNTRMDYPVEFDPETVIKQIPLILEVWWSYRKDVNRFDSILWFLLQAEGTPKLIKTIINARCMQLLFQHLHERLQDSFQPGQLCELMQELIETDIDFVIMHSRLTKGVLSDLLQSSFISWHLANNDDRAKIIRHTSLLKLARVTEIHNNRLPLHCLLCFDRDHVSDDDDLRQTIQSFIQDYPQACLSKDAGGDTPLLLAIKRGRDVSIIHILLEPPEGIKATRIRDADHQLPIEMDVPWRTFKTLFNAFKTLFDATQSAVKDRDMMIDNNSNHILPPTFNAAINNANLSNIYTLLRHSPHSLINLRNGTNTIMDNSGQEDPDIFVEHRAKRARITK